MHELNYSIAALSNIYIVLFIAKDRQGQFSDGLDCCVCQLSAIFGASWWFALPANWTETHQGNLLLERTRLTASFH